MPSPRKTKQRPRVDLDRQFTVGSQKTLMGLKHPWVYHHVTIVAYEPDGISIVKTDDLVAALRSPLGSPKRDLQPIIVGQANLW